MASRPLSRAGIDEFTLLKLQKAGITTFQQLLDCNQLFLMAHADLSLREAQTLINSVSAKLCCKPQTARQLLEQRTSKKSFLPTGLTKFDAAMGGGIIVGCISEVCGPPGVGKTQFCLTACVQAIVQRSLDEGGIINATNKFSVIYIDTEMKFDSFRLQQIARLQFPHIFQDSVGEVRDGGEGRAAAGNHELPSSQPPNSPIQSLLSAIKVVQPTCSAGLLNYIADSLQGDVIANTAKLVIVDSISAIARREQLTETEKDNLVLEQASALKALAEKCHCVILATNQVHSLQSPSSYAGLAPGSALLHFPDDTIFVEGSSGGLYRPALGVTWQHCCSCRLVLSQANIGQEALGRLSLLGETERKILLEKSPLAQTGVAGRFLISEEGFMEVVDAE